MRIADNILKAGALLYLMCVVLDSVFLFPDYNLVIENILFPIGLLYTIRVLVLNTSAFLVIFPLLLLFLWELLSTSIIHSRTGMEDVMYLFRLLKLPVVFTITLNALDSRFFSPDCMVRSGFYLLSAISLFIVLDPFGYGSMLHVAYTLKPEDLYSVFNEPGYFRSSGTLRSPNDNAFLFGIFLLYFLIKGTKRNWPEIFLAAGIVFLTQSRTVFVATFACWVIGIFTQLAGRERMNWLRYALVIMVVIGMVMYVKPHNLYSLMSGDAFRSTSYNLRMELFFEFWDNPLPVILAGLGSIRDFQALFGNYLDSEYSAVLYQFGVIGLVLWIMVWISLIILSRANINLMLLVLFVSLISVTNHTIHNPVVAPVLFCMLPFFLNLDRENLKTPAINRADKK